MIMKKILPTGLFFTVIIIMTVIGELKVYIEASELKATSKEDWIDPNDMINFDISAGRMRKKTKPKAEVEPAKALKTQSKNADKCPCLNGTSEKELDVLKLNLDDAVREKEMCELILSKKPTCDTPYFKQYIQVLINHFDGQVSEDEKSTFNIEVQVSKEDVFQLELFSNEQGGTIQAAHNVLTQMIQSVQLNDATPQQTLNERAAELFGGNSNLIILCLTMVSVVWGMHLLSKFNLSFWKVLVYSVIISFFMSIPWTWLKLYKKTVAKKQSDMLKLMPKDCHPQYMSTTQSIWEYMFSAFSFSTDKCAEYHEAMLVDPILDVPPTKALAVTVTTFIFEPAEHIGVALSRLIEGAMRDLPVHLAGPVFLVIICLLTMLLIFTCGYQVHVPWLLCISPAQRQSIREDSSMQLKLKEREETIKCLKEIIHEMKQLPDALPSGSSKSSIDLTDTIECVDASKQPRKEQNIECIPQDSTQSNQHLSRELKPTDLSHSVQDLKPLDLTKPVNIKPSIAYCDSEDSFEVISGTDSKGSDSGNELEHAVENICFSQPLDVLGGGDGVHNETTIGLKPVTLDTSKNTNTENKETNSKD